VSRSYPDGGVHILRGESSAAFIRCADYRERPSHADQLHVDLWMRGQNIAVDAGTFLYNGQGLWQNGLAHTAVHNTVTVDDADQMLWFSRFTWGEWARGRVLQQGEHLWQGEHDGYKRLGVQHVRSVISLEGERWLVVDHLVGNRPHHFSLQWLLNDFPHSVTPEQNLICLWPETDKFQIRMGLLEGDANFSLVRGDPDSTRGWRSRYYGQKEPALSVQLEARRTQAIFWTLFGFDGDAATRAGETLTLEMDHRSLQISLATPASLNQSLTGLA
jgi:asparagine synthase (glutamine-hydrolysing)